jgi:hypothetical protein
LTAPRLQLNPRMKLFHMNKNTTIVAVYSSHTATDEGIKELKQCGFDIKKISVVARDFHTDEHVVGYYNIGDRMKSWGKLGAFWDWIWGILFGSAFFLIPGLGPILVAGPLVGWIVGGLEGALVMAGLNALGAALYSIGIPKDSILRYETAVRAGKFLLIAHGSPEEGHKAKEILDRTKPESLEHH